ncbi:MAG TPA: lysophospholipid acyltransferase family protein [Nannocystaceae bacterium]|nr:lysophospholipid acyltransferase family protein [Nannocystaceae bacterium]
MLQPLRILLVGVCYVGFAVVGLLIGWVFVPIASFGVKDEMERVRRAQRTLGRCSRFWVWFMTAGGLIRLRRGELPGPLEPGHPAIVVANHPSLLDIFMIVATTPGITFVATASWYDSWLTGRLLRLGRHIRGPTEGAEPMPGETAVLDRIVAQLRDGYPVMMFPEGTRSPKGGGLRKFRAGAFEAAIRAEVPLWSLLLRVEPPALAKGQPWWDIPRERTLFSVDVLAVTRPTRADGSARDVARATRTAYARALGLPVEDASSLPMGNASAR